MDFRHRKTLLLASEKLRNSLRQAQAAAKASSPSATATTTTTQNTQQDTMDFPANPYAHPQRTPKKTASPSAANKGPQQPEFVEPKITLKGGATLSSLPKITLGFIQNNSNADGFAKGCMMYTNSAVHSMTIDLHSISAEVYDITIHNVDINKGGDFGTAVHKAVCQCEGKGHGWCEHIVAALLCIQHYADVHSPPPSATVRTPMTKTVQTPTTKTTSVSGSAAKSTPLSV